MSMLEIWKIITVTSTPISAPTATSVKVCTLVSSRLSATITAIMALKDVTTGHFPTSDMAANRENARAVCPLGMPPWI